jgi:hypothetical protein
MKYAFAKFKAVFLPSNLPFFQPSPIPLFRYSNIPSFLPHSIQSSILPTFHIPQFHYFNIPSFLQHSNLSSVISIPTFTIQHSKFKISLLYILPLFHSSIIPSTIRFTLANYSLSPSSTIRSTIRYTLLNYTLTDYTLLLPTASPRHPHPGFSY